MASHALWPPCRAWHIITPACCDSRCRSCRRIWLFAPFLSFTTFAFATVRALASACLCPYPYLCCVVWDHDPGRCSVVFAVPVHQGWPWNAMEWPRSWYTWILDDLSMIVWGQLTKHIESAAVRVLRICSEARRLGSPCCNLILCALFPCLTQSTRASIPKLRRTASRSARLGHLCLLLDNWSLLACKVAFCSSRSKASRISRASACPALSLSSLLGNPSASSWNRVAKRNVQPEQT